MDNLPLATTPKDPSSPTGRLSTWISSVDLSSVPPPILTRAKYLLLDGLGCGLVGAHLPWSEKAARVLLDLEPHGTAHVFGWGPETRLTPLSAALLNSTFIQGFELDDWHRLAPLHSNSIVVPALLAAVDHLAATAAPIPASFSDGAVTGGSSSKSSSRSSKSSKTFSGSEFLLAYLVGLEVGPRVGLGLWGGHVLSHGWHSGAVFGPSAAAAAVSRLLGLSPAQVEDALGIACTQAGGLMSAQFESEAKRMQHGFAARNGLLGAMLARGGYVGIKMVYEREYGGFLGMFSSGNGRTPQYKPEEVCKGLGEIWQTEGVAVKPYSSMAGTHATVDCLVALRETYPAQMANLDNIGSVLVELGQIEYSHGGFKATRPLTATGAQMSNAYVAATYLVDNAVIPAGFRHDKLERDEVWRLVDVTECRHTLEFDLSENKALGRTRVTVSFKDGTAAVSHEVAAAKGNDPPLTNEEIVEKFRNITKGVIDDDRRRKIVELVLSLETCEDVATLNKIMSPLTRNPIA